MSSTSVTATAPSTGATCACPAHEPCTPPSRPGATGSGAPEMVETRRASARRPQRDSSRRQCRLPVCGRGRVRRAGGSPRRHYEGDATVTCDSRWPNAQSRAHIGRRCAEGLTRTRRPVGRRDWRHVTARSDGAATTTHRGAIRTVPILGHATMEPPNCNPTSCTVPIGSRSGADADGAEVPGSRPPTAGCGRAAAGRAKPGR